MSLHDIGTNINRMTHSFGNPQEGYDKATEQFQKFWQQAVGFQQPYADAGKNQLPILTGAQGKLLNPTELLNDWMGKYQTSPYAQRSMENAKASGMDTASSMGLGGSSAALQNIQQSSSDIMNKDREGYLKDLMQKYMTGIGIGQDIYNTGATTAGNLGKQAGEVGQNMGGAAFGSASAPGEMYKNILSVLMKTIGGMQGGNVDILGGAS